MPPNSGSSIHSIARHIRVVITCGKWWRANSNQISLKDMAPWAETLSKAIAGIAIALYASGFLVVSL